MVVVVVVVVVDTYLFWNVSCSLCVLQLGLPKKIVKRRQPISWYFPFVSLTFYRLCRHKKVNKFVFTKELLQMCLSGVFGWGKILTFIYANWTKRCGWKFSAQKQKKILSVNLQQVCCLIRKQKKIEICDTFDFEEFIKHTIDDSLSHFSACFSNKEIEQNLLLEVFDHYCEEILQSNIFVNLCTASCHQNFHLLFIKYNLFQRGWFSVTIDKNTTHSVLLKSPRQGKTAKETAIWYRWLYRKLSERLL